MSRAAIVEDDYDYEVQDSTESSKSACHECNLFKSACTRCMSGHGNKDARIVIVGEAPGSEEDQIGRPFIGPAGKFLRRHVFRGSGLTDDDVYVTNAVRCYPAKDKNGKIKNPNIGQIRACRPHLYAELRTLKPRVILLMGNVALHGLLPIYKSKSSDDEKKSAGVSGITTWRGKQIWSAEFNCWVIPTFHPSALMRDFQNGLSFRLEQTVADVELAASLASKPLPKVVQPKRYFIDDEFTALKLLRGMATKPIVAYDIESEGFDPRTDEILGFALADSVDRGFFVTWRSFKDNKIAVGLLKQIMADKAIIKITHNGAFDDRFMRCKGFPRLINWEDTMIAAGLVDENFPRGLKPNAFRYTTFGGYDEELDIYRREHKLKTYKGIPMEVLGRYGGYDAVATFRLWTLFEPILRDQGLYPLYKKIIMPVRNVMNDAEQTGFKVDVVRAKELDILCDKAVVALTKQAYKHAGEQFNLKSNPQLQRVLYDKLKLKAPANIAKTKTGGRSCNTKVLQKMVDQPNGAIAQSLLDLKYITSQQSKFIKMIINNAWEDGRVHTNYNVTGTVTGRTSCSNPGIHNIPRDRFIRSIFMSSANRKLVEADVKSAELRLLAAYCGEEFLLKAFREGRDLHSETYKIMFDKPDDYVPTDDERFIAKSINFGLIYGRGPKSLAEVLGVSLDEAKRLIALYFEKMPKVKIFLDTNIKFTLVNGYAVSLFRRRRRLPGIMSDDYVESSRAGRQANNSVIQSAAADYTYIILARVSRAIKAAKLKAEIVHTVHDCVIVDTPDNEVELVKQIIVKAYTEPVNAVPIGMEMDIGVVDRWGEHKDSKLEAVLARVGVIKLPPAKKVEPTIIIKQKEAEDLGKVVGDRAKRGAGPLKQGATVAVYDDDADPYEGFDDDEDMEMEDAG